MFQNSDFKGSLAAFVWRELKADLSALAECVRRGIARAWQFVARL